jgi:hypothetical protein
VPDRTPADLVHALLVIPAELWLLSRIWSTTVSWLNIWFGARRDGWAAQAAAESGKGGSDLIGKLMAAVLVGGAAIAAGTWWWIEKAGAEVQQQVLTTGWSVITVMTLVLTGFALLSCSSPPAATASERVTPHTWRHWRHINSISAGCRESSRRYRPTPDPGLALAAGPGFGLSCRAQRPPAPARRGSTPSAQRRPARGFGRSPTVGSDR